MHIHKCSRKTKWFTFMQFER